MSKSKAYFMFWKEKNHEAEKEKAQCNGGGQDTY